MVNVNKHRLPKRDLEKLFEQLNLTLAKLDKNSAGAFLEEILGYEERLTVAKRLASIVLLAEGYSQYKTAKLLKLSPTTVEGIATRLEQGNYRGTIAILGKSKKNYFLILEALDSILHLGGALPHYNGLDRYRF